MKSWNTLTAHFKRRFGQRAQKIPLDAGSTCPNRDGALSRAGCTFCNAVGSGSGLAAQGMSLADQWALWRAHFLASGKAALFLAYFQSFSNTYGPAARLARLLDDLEGLADLGHRGGHAARLHGRRKSAPARRRSLAGNMA